MIKRNLARTLSGVVFLAAAGLAAAGCSATANASPTANGTSGAQTSTGQATTAPAVTLPTHATSTAPSTTMSTAPANPATSAAKPAPASGVSRCHTSELSASYTVVPGSAGAGNISYNLRLTNTSMHQCTIYGFAGMLLLDANHKPLPTHVVWDSLVPKRLVRLNPGGSAAATVRFSPDVPGVGDNGPAPAGKQWQCQTTSVYTEVTPPDETTQLVTAVSPPTPVCESGTMQASAFVAGPSGPNQ